MLGEKSGFVRRFLILGYTGYGNIGDELMLESARRFLRSAFQNVVFITLLPDRGRLNPVHILRSLKKSDGVVLCGGNLFQDETSFRSFLYYWSVVRAALSMNKKVFFLNQGLGPLQSRIARKLLKSILSNRNVGGYLRDRVSFRYAASCNSGFKLGWDTAVMAIEEVVSSLEEEPVSDYVCVIPTMRAKEKDVVEAITKMNKREVRLLSFEPRKDRIVLSRLADMLNKEGISTQIAPVGLKEALSVIAGTEFVISYRLHGALIAAYLGVPFVVFGSAKNMRVLNTMDRDFRLFFKDGVSLLIALSHLKTYDFELLKRKYREELEKQKGNIIEEIKDFFTERSGDHG